MRVSCQLHPRKDLPPRYSLYRSVGGPQYCRGDYREYYNLVHLPLLKPQVLCCPGRSPVTTVTELSQLPYVVCLTVCTQPGQKRVPHTVRSTVSVFNGQCPVFPLRSCSSCLFLSPHFPSFLTIFESAWRFAVTAVTDLVCCKRYATLHPAADWHPLQCQRPVPAQWQFSKCFRSTLPHLLQAAEARCLQEPFSGLTRAACQGRIKLFGAPRQWKHFRPLFQAVFLSGWGWGYYPPDSQTPRLPVPRQK